MQPTDLSLSPCTHAHNLRWHEGGSAGSTRAALRDVVDLTGCDRAVQQQGAAEKPLLLKKKKKKQRGGVRWGWITQPWLQLLLCPSTRFLPAICIPCINRNRALYTAAALFSLQVIAEGAK